MSAEKFPGRSEQHEHNLEKEESEHTVERDRPSPESAVHKQEKPIDIEKIRRSIEQKAKDTEDIIEASRPKLEQEPQTAFVNRELKEMAYQRLLNRARKQMPTYDRLMSHIIHQPVIDKASEVAGRTVARPSGVLGGGVLAFFGTLAYYFIAKHYGYDYNFFVFLLLLGAGVGVGWTLELFWQLFKKRSKKK